jgi:hypothetical protein
MPAKRCPTSKKPPARSDPDRSNAPRRCLRGGASHG